MPEIELVAEDAADAVWIGPPVPLHVERAIAAMRRGRHVIVEKPMALSLAEADAMIATARDAGVQLLGGHTSYSYQLPIRVMRRIALSGELGQPRFAMIWSVTDWLLRPRPLEERAADAGAGLVHRQAPHQIETLRLLGAAPLRSVRASVGAWDPGREEPCAYTALFTYEDGMSATIGHDGRGYFTTLELFPEAASFHPYDADARVAMRRAIRGGELPTRGPKAGARSVDEPWSPIDIGLVVLTCERGDVRHAPDGLWIYGDDGLRHIELRSLLRERHRGESDLGGGAIIQALLELKAAVDGVAPLAHDGAWGRATLEATLAVLHSAEEHREILLQQQTMLPAAYDEHLTYAESTKPGSMHVRERGQHDSL